MLAKKILENLKNGNYRIEYREKCDCDFYWYVKDGDYVCDVVKYGGCYHETALIMDDLAGEVDDEISIGYNGIIATFNSYYGISLQIGCNEQDIAFKIRRYIVNDTEIFRDFIANLNYPDARNEIHEKRKGKALVEFLTKGDKRNI
jgi:hypothetical protein